MNKVIFTTSNVSSDFGVHYTGRIQLSPVEGRDFNELFFCLDRWSGYQVYVCTIFRTNGEIYLRSNYFAISLFLDDAMNM